MNGSKDEDSEVGRTLPPPRPDRRPRSVEEAWSPAAVMLGHSDGNETASAAQRSGQQEISAEQRDMHGFKLTGTDYIATYRQWIPFHQKKLAERKAKWQALFRKSPGSSYLESKDLKKLVRKGLPDSSRGEVWMDISGASKLLAANPGSYRKLVDTANAGCAADSKAQIELDLPRTFPDHMHFRGEMETPLVKSLRNVLMAYANRNKKVGYCQGMNFIAGIMLLFLDEEKVFWLLCALLEYILPSDYYAEDLRGCNVDLRVFKNMILKRHPKLMKRCDEAGLGVEFFGLEWFIAIFAKTFPIETTLRVWDCIFNEGDKIVFRVGLGMLEQYEKSLLAIKEPHELFAAVQESVHIIDAQTVSRGSAMLMMNQDAALQLTVKFQALGRAELDADNLLKVAFALHMKRSQVEDLRKQYSCNLRDLCIFIQLHTEDDSLKVSNFVSEFGVKTVLQCGGQD